MICFVEDAIVETNLREALGNDVAHQAEPARTLFLVVKEAPDAFVESDRNAVQGAVNAPPTQPKPEPPGKVHLVVVVVAVVIIHVIVIIALAGFRRGFFPLQKAL